MSYLVLTSLLFPTSMMTMLGLEYSLASSSHRVRCWNVSRLQQPAASGLHTVQWRGRRHA